MQLVVRREGECRSIRGAGKEAAAPLRFCLQAIPGEKGNGKGGLVTFGAEGKGMNPMMQQGAKGMQQKTNIYCGIINI